MAHTILTIMLSVIPAVGAFMPARVGSRATAHRRAPVCGGMVASWYDTGQRLTRRYDPEVQHWPSIGGKTGYHRMNGARPKPAWNSDLDLGQEPAGTEQVAGDAAELQAASPHASTAGVAGMPGQLAEWGCDAALWDRMPAGAHRDLTRFARDGIEGLARNRMATMASMVKVPTLAVT